MKKPLIEEKFIWLNGKRVKALVPKPLTCEERNAVEKNLELGLKKIVIRSMKENFHKTHQS